MYLYMDVYLYIHIYMQADLILLHFTLLHFADIAFLANGRFVATLH